MPGSLVTKHAIVVNKSQAVTLDYLSQFSYQKQALILYKRFYKLRIYQNDARNQENYLQAIKRRFTTHKFETRRSKFLSNYSSPLSAQEMCERAVNTLAFVQNAAVYSKSQDENPRMESKILATILRTEGMMKKNIKYDFKFKWVDDLSRYRDQIEFSAENKSNYRKMFSGIDDKLSHLGYYDYFESLSVFNERYKLCL